MQLPNTSAAGSTIGMALPAKAVLTVVTVLITKAVLPGTAAFMRGTMVMETLPRVGWKKVAAASLETIRMAMAVIVKQVFPKAEAAMQEIIYKAVSAVFELKAVSGKMYDLKGVGISDQMGYLVVVVSRRLSRR